MKLVFYTHCGIGHFKNFNGIQLMCKSLNIDFEHTHNQERLMENNYDILYCIYNFVNPDEIPENIKIIYGPQFWIFPEPPFIGPLNEKLKKRCVFNSVSLWIKELYIEMAKELIIPMVQFPFAVDTNYFKPSEMTKEYDCVIYIKRRADHIINQVVQLLNDKNITFVSFKYGSYDELDYRDKLGKCKFMISLDAHESQGFALEEAMSCDVPLLVLDATSMYDEMPDGMNSFYENYRPKNLFCTSVPYWSDECGIKITEPQDLGNTIDTMMNTYQNFTPREYILRTLSDKVCMKRILDYFDLPSPVL